ncbi:MAG: flippase [Chloroflexota bacterium]
MTRLNRYTTDLLIVASFLILPLLLFWSVTLGSKTMLPADNLFQWEPWTAVSAEFDLFTAPDGSPVPQNPLISDLIIQNYAWKQFINDSLADGQIPLWNPNLFAGVPFLATGQHGALYPFSIFFLILPIAKAYGWYTVSQIWLAGVLAYLFGRVLGMRKASAAVVGFVYQGGGFLIVSAAVFPMIIGAVAWLPLLLACIEKVVQSAGRNGGNNGRSLTPLLWASLGAIGLGMQILAGHAEFTYYTLLIMALYAVWRVLSEVVYPSTGESRWQTRLIQPSIWLAGMVAVGLMLGAVQFIPLFEVGQVNFREGSTTFEEVLGFAFPNRRILTLLLPNFFGNPAHHQYFDLFTREMTPFLTNVHGNVNPWGPYSSSWGIKNYVEGGMYLGIFALVLAVIAAWAFLRPSSMSAGVVRARRSQTLFFGGLSFISLAFIFGTPLYAILYYGLPFINQLHTPFRWVFPLSLCVAALAGFGADYLEEKRLEIRESDLSSTPKSLITNLQSLLFLRGKPSVHLFIAGALFWGGIAALVGLLGSFVVYGRLEPIVERVLLSMALAADAFPNAASFYSYLFPQFLILAVMLIGSGLAIRLSQRTPMWIVLTAVLIISDIFLANRGFNAAVDTSILEYQPPLTQWLQAQPGEWRITSFDSQGQKPFNANSGWLFDLEDVRGYDSIIPKQYTQYMAAIEPQNELIFNRVQPIVNWESLNSPLLDVLGVKYIITSETLDLPKLDLAWEEGNLRVYENLAVAPRAYTLPQSQTAVFPDPLAAMSDFDPRQFVVVATSDLDSETGDSLPSTSNLQSPNEYKPATVTSYTNIEVFVDARVNDPSWLILNDSYFPGWRAYLRPLGGEEADEREVEITRVNGNFRGVLLGPGEWTVRYRYSPRSFQLGGLISFMGGILILFGLIVGGWRRFANRSNELSTTQSIIKNSGAPMALNLFNKLIDFAFAAFYLRLLGPADAGSYGFAIATAIIFEILSNFGLNILLVRDVSQERDQASSYLLNTTILRLLTSAVAVVPMLVFVLGSRIAGNPISTPELLALILIMVGMIFSGMSQGITGLFYVYEEAEIPAAMTTVTTLLKVGLGVAVLLVGFGFVGLAAVSIIVNIITLLILARIAFGRFPLNGPWQVDWPLQREMVRKGYPLMLIHFLQTIFISIDVVLLRFLKGPEVVGWYNSAYKWFNALQIIPSFFTLALFPIISREIGRKMESARRMYRLSLKLMLLLALPIATGTFFLAYFLVDILAGDEFLPHGAIALQIVMWSIPLGWLNSVTNYVLIALGLEHMQPRAFGIAVGFNIVANLIFIPFFGYVAAAITTVLSELVLLIIFDYYLRQKMEGLNWMGFLGRPFLATLIMFVTMWAASQLHLALAALLGPVAYFLALWFLRIIGDEELQILRTILPTPIATRLRLV